MKKRKQKQIEYIEKYQDIPIDYQERLSWMIDKFNLTTKKMDEIINRRDELLREMSYSSLRFVLYEEPEGSPRPRFRIINRNQLLNAAIANSNFVHVYSPTGKDDNMYMRRIIDQQEIIQLEQLLCTPCIVEYNTFHKTPSYYNTTDKFLAEMGIYRPQGKPDWDNIGKKYSDMFNDNIWIDDIVVIDGSIHKYYSMLPRVEINLYYLNKIYNKHQYNSIIKRKDFNGDISYFGGEN